MKRRDTLRQRTGQGPVIGPAEEVGVSSLYDRRTGFKFAMDYLFPWLLFILVMVLIAWGVHLYIRELPKKVVLQHPIALWFLIALPFLAFYAFRRAKARNPNFKYSRLALLTSIKPGIRSYFKTLPPTLRLAAMGMLIFVFARPTFINVYEESSEKGIDIVIALDVSLSMEARDLSPNRLVAAKEVTAKFIKSRPNDRIGLVVFGKYAYPYCPLTLDHRAVDRLLMRIKLRSIDDGQKTAIGEALGTALVQLERSKSKSKVIILLTDGDNNSGEMQPMEAAKYAAALGVKIHTILMGNPNDKSGGLGFFFARAPVNPKLLEQIASTTQGTAYQAIDKAALEQRFNKILDKMKKTKFSHKYRTKQGIQGRFLLFAIILLFLELLLSITWLRRLP
ncbi:VWA domain-containing protein [Myxococcota bacterium]|nr:VWA domain-containing protein [Myxococcota bacterium]MBU1536788.1 VWA domain-containing protein [Myxococcota bacterium]